MTEAKSKINPDFINAGREILGLKVSLALVAAKILSAEPDSVLSNQKRLVQLTEEIKGIPLRVPR